MSACGDDWNEGPMRDRRCNQRCEQRVLGEAVTDAEKRFEEIYRAYSGLIFAYAVRRTSNPSDAADIVADTFAVAWRRLEDVPDGEEARPWLYGVARRIASRYYRTRRRRRRAHRRLMDEAEQLVESATVTTLDSSYRQAIAAAFSQLSDSDQELLKLVAWENLEREEIAEMLDCSRVALRVRLHRARKRFDRHLRKAGVDRTNTSRVASNTTTATSPILADIEEV